MKKKLIMAITLIGVVATMAACGKMEIGPTIEIPDYKNTEVTVEPVKVTAEDVDAFIQDKLQGAAIQEEVTDRAIQAGDTANINYEGKKDGVAFEGGTAEGFDLVIGSGQFIPGFEDGLIGAKKGDTLDIELTFPEDYQSEDLAGQAVVFTVTVNSIKGSVVPELTDELVTTFDAECKTIDEYKKKVEADLLEEQTKAYHQNIGMQVFDSIYKQVTVDTPPQDLLDKYKAKATAMAEQYATVYQADLKTFVTEVLKMTMEEFEKENETMAMDMVKEHLVWNSIAKKEGISITEAEIKDFAKEKLEESGLATVDEYIEQVGKEEIQLYLLSVKALEALEKSAVIKESESTEN